MVVSIYQALGHDIVSTDDESLFSFTTATFGFFPEKKMCKDGALLASQGQKAICLCR